jgi:hypothetical protein
MADQKVGNTNQTGSGSTHGLEKAPGRPKTVVDQAKSVSDQAFSVGRDLKDKAKDMAGSSADAIKDQTSQLVDAAKDVASQATDKFKQTVDGQKAAGAEYVGSLADTMRRAASEFDGDLPIAGTYMRKAASQFESVADTIKTGNFNDLVRGAQSFARRQPTAFLGIAVLAGFGVVRFLKSSADNSESGSTGGGASRSQANYGSNRSTTENKGYRDDFTR